LPAPDVPYTPHLASPARSRRPWRRRLPSINAPRSASGPTRRPRARPRSRDTRRALLASGFLRDERVRIVEWVMDIPEASVLFTAAAARAAALFRWYVERGIVPLGR
jgi:hypothetical protein